MVIVFLPKPKICGLKDLPEAARHKKILGAKPTQKNLRERICSYRIYLSLEKFN